MIQHVYVVVIINKSSLTCVRLYCDLKNLILNQLNSKFLKIKVGDSVSNSIQLDRVWKI